MSQQKAVTVYFSEREEEFIAAAAKKLGMSVSGFIAEAAMAQARFLTPEPHRHMNEPDRG